MKKILFSLMLLTFGFACFSPAHATVTNTTSKIIYSGTGSTATFSFPFKIYSTTDLVLTEIVVSTGIQTTLSLNSDYTVSLSSVPNSGTVTLLAGNLPTGTRLVIQRVLPLTQQINISDYSPTPAMTWNEGYDRGVMLSQQLQEQISRAILRDVTQSTQITFPSPVNGQCIGWNGSTLVNLTCAGGGGGGGSNYFPPIGNTEIQAITASNKVSGTSLYLLNNTPSGAGVLPLANIPTIPDSQLSQITTASKVSGTAITGLASVPVGSGALPVFNGGTGQTTAQAAIDALTVASAGTNGQVWTTNGTNGSWGSASSLNKALYLTPGTTTWTAPAGITSVSVTMIGGGRNGNGHNNNNGGDAYAGAYAFVKYPLAVTAGNSYTVTVGNVAQDSVFSSLTAAAAPGSQTHINKYSVGRDGTIAVTTAGGVGGGSEFGIGGATNGGAAVGYGASGGGGDGPSGTGGAGTQGFVLIEW